MDEPPSWLLTQAAMYAHRIVADVFAGAGARGHHYRLLASLAHEGPASQASLGRRTGIHLSDMVAALNEMQAAGFVARSPDPADRRRNVITLTPAGRERLGELSDSVRHIQEEVFAPLDEDERRQFAAGLRKLHDHHRARVSPVAPVAERHP
jgi:DNA-binding MarR family transcriptional regulator